LCVAIELYQSAQCSVFVILFGKRHFSELSDPALVGSLISLRWFTLILSGVGLGQLVALCNIEGASTSRVFPVNFHNPNVLPLSRRAPTRSRRQSTGTRVDRMSYKAPRGRVCTTVHQDVTRCTAELAHCGSTVCAQENATFGQFRCEATSLLGRALFPLLMQLMRGTCESTAAVFRLRLFVRALLARLLKTCPQFRARFVEDVLSETHNDILKLVHFGTVELARRNRPKFTSYAVAKFPGHVHFCSRSPTKRLGRWWPFPIFLCETKA